METATFSSMVTAHANQLHAHALNFTRDAEDANDLVQDTLIKALRFKEGFQEGSNFKGWLFVIMRNTFINDYRKNARKNAIITTEEEISSVHLSGSAADNGAEHKFAMQDIHNALNGLAEAYRMPFVRYVEGYKYHEIAEELEIPLGTVKTHIHQARIALKKKLKLYR